MKQTVLLYKQEYNFDYEECIDIVIENLADNGYYIVTEDYLFEGNEKYHKGSDIEEELEEIVDRVANGDERVLEVMQEFPNLKYQFIKRNGKANKVYIGSKGNCPYGFDSFGIGIVVTDKEDFDFDFVDEQLDYINEINHSTYFNTIEVTEANALDIIEDLENYDINFDCLMNDNELANMEEYMQIDLDGRDYGYIAFKLRKHFGIKETENG